ncbi:MAG: DNA repair protein RecN [Candidatus Nanopelagicales bacterium]|nr:DNA repair protein RecN [Candidatus Nanopelagicales bacterium]
MITGLSIHGMGVIDDAHMSFSPGLTVITGETGAGKTMVLTGLGLLAGDRADASLVRRGELEASVEGTWLVSSDSTAIITRLQEAGAPPDIDADAAEIVLARTVPAHGRGRSIACGRTVPRPLLEDVSSGLIAIHGQADQWQLRSADRQREMLDRFAGAPCADALRELRALLAQWRADVEELDGLTTHRAEREREAETLRAGIEEIDAVAPEVDEDQSLDLLAARLENAGTLLADLTLAHDALVGGELDDGAIGEVAAALKALDRLTAIDPSLGELRAQLRQASALIADAGIELASSLGDLDADPARQAWVEERRAAIRRLLRTYGDCVADVLEWRAAAAATLLSLDGGDERVEQLRASIELGRSELAQAAVRLTHIRAAAALELAEHVSAELRSLAMPDAELVVQVEATAAVESFTASGADTVQFLLRPHMGADALPVTRAASGGELSRVMLAIEVTMAGRHSVPTFVFDEVDAGIGGRTAIEVGRRLARLARQAQVIVVTHLPQVAAFADRHLVVLKSSDGSVTASSVRDVTGADRAAELARMLSGLDESDTGLAHAEELLAVAAAERSR